jgi:hypothetical protein
MGGGILENELGQSLPELRLGHFKCTVCGHCFRDKVQSTMTCHFCGTRIDAVEASETARADIW